MLVQRCRFRAYRNVNEIDNGETLFKRRAYRWFCYDNMLLCMPDFRQKAIR